MRTRYHFKTPVADPARFVARLATSERAIVSDDPIHYPPDFDFLVNVDEPLCPRLRHYATDAVASPIAVLQLRPVADGVEIDCRFESRNAPFSAAQRDDDAPLVSSRIDVAALVVGWLWRILVWNLWLDPLLQRRAMKRYASKLLARIKAIAEEDGIALSPES